MCRAGHERIYAKISRSQVARRAVAVEPAVGTELNNAAIGAAHLDEARRVVDEVVS